MTGAVTIVVATRNRRHQLLRTLRRLHELPGRPPVIVVDNASDDGSPDAVREHFERVGVICLDRNEGAVARNIGARTATTPFVAFADDDSWWEPGALDRVVELFEEHPRLGLIAARVLVGEDRRTDPISEVMAASPLPETDGLPGRPVLGFLACAAVVRRDAFIEVGGFSRVVFFGGEETLLAWDLADRAWALRYVDDVIAHHDPVGQGREPDRRRALGRRNDVLVRWMRRPVRIAAAATAELVRDARHDPVARQALRGAVARLPAALGERRRLGPDVERAVDLLESTRVRAGHARTWAP